MGRIIGNTGLIPAISWTFLVLVITILLLCITVILRRPWTEQEKLTYPIIQLPLSMSNPKTRLFHSRLFWIGFAVAAIVDIINGLNYLYPSVPYIPVRGIRLDHYFTEKPWNAIGWTPIRFRFFMIGMTYLLPLDLSISCWFFYILRKIERIAGAITGWSNIPGYPFLGQQSMGAVLGICIIALVSINRHLRDVIKKVFLGTGIDDSREPFAVSWRGFWHCDLQRTAWHFRSTDGIVALGRSNLLSPFPDDVYCYGTHPR